MGSEPPADTDCFNLFIDILVVLSPVHNTTLAQRPASVLDTDKDAHTSVSEDAGAAPFTVLRLTSVYRTKNTLRQWFGAAKSPRLYKLCNRDRHGRRRFDLVAFYAVVSIKRFL